MQKSDDSWQFMARILNSTHFKHVQIAMELIEWKKILGLYKIILLKFQLHIKQ